MIYIVAFKKEGWNCVHAHEVFEDPIYGRQPTHVPVGERLI